MKIKRKLSVRAANQPGDAEAIQGNWTIIRHRKATQREFNQLTET